MMTNTTNTAAEAVDLDSPIVLTCPRCGGRGHLGQGFTARPYGTCFRCHGAGNVGTTTQRELDEKAARAEKRAAAKERKLARIAAKVDAMLADDAELSAAFEVDHDIIADIRARLYRKGEISDKARAFAIKLAAETTERKAAEAERKAKLTDLEAGRQELTGKVISFKSYENNFGTTLKFLVELDNGNRVFGTLPRALYGAERGDRVTFTATVEPKETGFGFFSRPSKASVVEAANNNNESEA